MPESSDTSPQGSVEHAPRTRPFIVGIGASAGGMTPLHDFFANVPPDSSTVYAVILHPRPDDENRLAEMLQSTAPIPIVQVSDTTPIVANRVYVLPANRQLGIVDEMFTVGDLVAGEQRLAPVDTFFRILAETHGSRSACVILSGTGANGSTGLRHINEYGGLVLAEDPTGSEYPDMPRHAIGTGCVDLVLRAADMPAKIHDYFDRVAHGTDNHSDPAASVEDPEALREVLTLLRLRTGHDFSNYKAPTVKRRIGRRMTQRGIDSVEAYASLVQQEPEEAVALVRELLINVTNFFRDPYAWATLREHVVPRLFSGKTPRDQVRVWVPGCATGEEAYSIAMLLSEYAATVSAPPAIQIFATDLDKAAIDRARAALYSDAEIANVPEHRLKRFFYREARGYCVHRELRELVLFATHNVIKDPPFSYLDLISCRNVLMYLNRDVQERVIETFHFALRPGRYLFLGGSEAPDGQNDLFMRVDSDAHIYESRTVTSRAAPVRPRVPKLETDSSEPRVTAPQPRVRALPADLHQRLLEQYAPPSLVVNEEHTVLHMSDRVGRYLHLRGGEPSRDLLQLARPELGTNLRAALHQAARDRTAVEVPAVAVVLENGPQVVDIRVMPVLREGAPARGFFVVTFDERAGGSEPPLPSVATTRAESVPDHLEEELKLVKLQLTTAIEQYETQAEEARASNEELQAMNEELRSAAEELETSKEELQSVNEELSTVNHELKTKIDELEATNNNFQNFINATDIGTIYLDRALRVRFSTPAARAVFHLLDADIGRPLTDITSKLRTPVIHGDIRTVLDRLTPIEREVETEDGRWHVMRILPYRTVDNRIDGVVITFQDVSDRRAAEIHARLADERLRLLIESALDYAMFTMDEHGTIDSWNPGAERMFGYRPHEIVGTNVSVLFTPEDRMSAAPERELQEAARTGRSLDERVHVRKDATRIYCSGVTRRLGEGGIGFAKVARDLTGQRELADALAHARDELETLVAQRTGELAFEVQAHESAKAALTTALHRLVTSQEDERSRIARDLHDDMGQRLTTLRLALERVRQAPEAMDGELDHAFQLLGEIGRQVNFLSWQLRPAVLDELGLAAALPRFITAWSTHVGISAEFRSTGYQHGQLPPDAELVFYRVAQEALNNVAKHASATRVDVLLGANDGRVVLVVEDDGIGFDSTDVSTASRFGLVGMRERAALAGATLQIESSPGHGTSVYLRRQAEPPARGRQA